MSKKISAFIAFVMMFSLILHQPQVQAATAIKIYIDGVVLETDQAPIAIGGRTLVPLRGIFEALNARVFWNQKAQTVTAMKGDTTVVLKLGSKTATINNQTVVLDTPAQAINGRTVVPIRFVSESLGEEVNWDSKSQSVLITTSGAKVVGAATYVNAIVNGQNGDGRDLQVSFYPPVETSFVNEYRILVVKAENASSFNLAKAQTVGSANYTTVPTNRSGLSNTLSSQARDVDGALIRTNQSYRVFVLTVGKDNYALSDPSGTVILSSNLLVNTATNVTIADVNDNGDGRDVLVNFTKAQNDSNISSYRVMIVKSKDASSFTLAMANAVPSAYYTTVSKTSSSMLASLLSADARDTSGEYIKNGVAYTAFVLSVGSNSTSLNNLSAPSTSVTLTVSSVAPIITSVLDVSNNGDGRDLQVSFIKAADESNIRYYRIFVVRENDYSSFNVSEANKVSSGRYLDVSKTGNNISQTLSSSTKDVKGNSITNGVAYRVFVMSVTSSNSNNLGVLSGASYSIVLSGVGVSAVTNVTVSDVSDYNNGQDLRVAFTKASDESRISHYRIFVVKASNASSFNLATANAISNTDLYTFVPKTGGNISLVLSANARDVNGALVQNGVSYRVFVLSVGDGLYVDGNMLSANSSSITLSGKSISPATNVAASDVSDYNNGQDLRVSFTKSSNESDINHYRIFVVKTSNASSFDLATANAITNPELYTLVYKTGGNISQVLSANARDVNGAFIRNDNSYRVFVLAVANGSVTNTLSNPSDTITLTQLVVVSAPEVQGVTAEQNGYAMELKVGFTLSDESGLAHYAVMLVPESAGALTEEAAAAYYKDGKYIKVDRTVKSLTLTGASLDVKGAPMAYNVQYRIYVLSIADGTRATANKLSSSNASVKLIEAVQEINSETTATGM